MYKYEMIKMTFPGTHAHEGRRILGAPAPGMLHKAWAAAAPGPAGLRHDCHEKNDDPLRANLLFVLSADQVRANAMAVPSRCGLCLWPQAQLHACVSVTSVQYNAWSTCRYDGSLAAFPQKHGENLSMCTLW